MGHKLSESEKRILCELLKDASTSNVEIAKRVQLTPAAVGKIKKRLEDNGVIRDYCVDLNLKEIGLTTFVIVFMKVKDPGWDFQNGLGITDLFVSTPNIINIFRIPEGDTSHILIYAFRNLDEIDRYFHVLQSQFSKYIEIKKMYTFSNDSIIKDNPREVLTKIVTELGEERMPEPIFPQHRKGKRKRVAVRDRRAR